MGKMDVRHCINDREDRPCCSNTASVLHANQKKRSIRLNAQVFIVFLVAFLAFTLLVPLQPSIVPLVYASSNGSHWGVNYSSDNWQYNTGDTILKRDFLLFHNSGIDIISVMLTWSAIEPSLGVFNKAFLNRIIHLCAIANAYGIDVILDFHTLSDDNSYTIPSWVFPRRLATVVLNPKIRNSWLNYQLYVINYFSGIKNLHSWHIMNEPLIKGHGETQQGFVDLWTDEVALFRAHSDLPISLRFGCWSFNAYWKNCSKIYDLFDYMSYNWYPAKGKTCLTNSVNLANSHGLQPVITEYGLGNWNDANQDASYVYQINLFRSMGINFGLAWQYGDFVGGLGYSLYNMTGNRVRPAFYRIAQANDAQANGVQGVSVLEVTSAKTIIEEGFCTDVEVTVLNEGTSPESFLLGVYANSTLVDMRNVTVQSGSSTVLHFTCNMTVPCGKYTINVAIEPLPGQTNVAYNHYTGSNITVTVQGDLNGDFTADLVDLVMLAQAYGSKPGNANWNPNADIDNNGTVGLLDFVILAACES